ncbi:MAG: penicillin-binding transpeptidase domain-containing protein [Lachnospiraceae bacterium]
MARRKLKQYNFSKKMQKKLVVVFLAVLLALLVLVGRIVYINFVSGEKYTKKVLDQQEYTSRVIPFQRGDIVDRNGTILATSTDVYNLILDCKVLNAKKENREPTISALTKCFDELTEEKLYEILEEKANSQYTVLLKKLPYEKIQAFINLQDEKDKNPNIAGVWFEKEYERNYPYQSLAASVIGFTTSGNEGINGLENSYNDVLNGMNGREYGYLNSDSNFETTVKNAENGKTIVSTIDTTIQSIVEKKVLSFNKEHENAKKKGPGSKSTSVLVVDPNSGELLAMADYPSYDLNKPWDLTPFFKQKKIDKMSEESKLDFLNKLWENFSITYTYEPGSTVKPFTVAAGLDSGKLKGKETFLCNGVERIGGHDIHCVNRSGHGKETIRQAIMNSCNDALMQIGKKVGEKTFCEYQNTFGFGLKTNIDLPGEARTDSLIYTEDTIGKTSLATNSFGQNFNVTMIQVASAFSSLINGGNYYQPHLVKEIQDSNGTVVEKVKPLLLKQTISKETSETVKSYLYSTVQAGTAKSAKVKGYTMGGKTGTAQKLPRGNRKYLVSFIGYAPADHPKVLVYVVIDEVNDENQAQSGYATTLAKEILEEILPYMNVYPDEGKEDTYTGEEGSGSDENYNGDIFD